MRVPQGMTAALYLQVLRRDAGNGRQMTESGHQMCAFQYFTMMEKLDPIYQWIHSVPNGGKRSPDAAGKMKGEGQKAGVPDVFLDVPRGGYHALRIELKTPHIPAVKGMRYAVQPGRTSDDQDRWLEHYNAQGYCGLIAFGCVQLIDHVENYLAGKYLR